MRTACEREPGSAKPPGAHAGEDAREDAPGCRGGACGEPVPSGGAGPPGGDPAPGRCDSGLAKGRGSRTTNFPAEAQALLHAPRRGGGAVGPGWVSLSYRPRRRARHLARVRTPAAAGAVTRPEAAVRRPAASSGR